MIVPICRSVTVSLAVLLLVCVSATLQSAEETVTFDTPEQAQLYSALLREYRCLKCQNQNLADSHASLAADLRREIRDRILEGKTQADIDTYLVDRYGEFVLYRPRFSSKTVILWVGPFVLLFVSVFSVVMMIRRRAAGRDREIARMDAANDSNSNAMDDQNARLARARQLLDD